MWGLLGKIALSVLASKNSGTSGIIGLANNINSARKTGV